MAPTPRPQRGLGVGMGDVTPAWGWGLRAFGVEWMLLYGGDGEGEGVSEAAVGGVFHCYGAAHGVEYASYQR